MVSRWKHYDPQWADYEHSLPPAFPWDRGYAKEKMRYMLGEDGYWFDPNAVDSNTALLSCVGDLMCEPRMTKAHQYGDTYFFHPLFQYVRNIFRSSDFCVANLETTLSDNTPYAGDYHCIAGKYHCNGPACYLDAVCYAGFDALVTANNHNCDSGIGGLWDTLRNIDSHGLMRTGAFLPTDRERVLLVKVKGFKIAILSYGNRYNDLDQWHFTKKGIERCLNWFSKEVCQADVAYAREHGAEFVICYQHWGKDYDLVPNQQQQTILEALKDCGVDYVIGSHTHCLQAHNTFTDSQGKTVPMMWSLGNFVTNETKDLCRHTGILQLTLRRENGGIQVQEHLIPCYVFDEFGTGRFCVVPTDTTLNGGYSHPRFESINAFIRDRVGPDIPFLPGHAFSLSALCKEMGIETDLPDRPVTRICAQSADVCHGSVYFAFSPLSKADWRRLVAANVTAMITEEPDPRIPSIVVSDVAAAYCAAYRYLRPLGDGVSVILVAGHHGKTLTKDLLVRVLQTAGGVLTPNDGEHTTTAPWQALHPSHDYCVLELRDDHPLGTAFAASLCRPDTVVVTAAPCDVAALADSLPDGGTLWYNETDPELQALVSNLDADRIRLRPYGRTTLPCPALPYDILATCTGAAREIGLSQGLPLAQIEQAVVGYRLQGLEKTKFSCDGVSLVLNTNCRSADEAASTLRAAPEAERRIVVTTPAFANTFAPWATALFQIDDTHSLADGEEFLLSVLQEGAVLVLCGDRNADFSYLVRRIFGITDGFLFGGS